MITFNGKISDGTVIMRGPRASDYNFDLDTIDRDDVITPGSVADHTVNDVVYTTNASATIDHNFNVSPTNAIGSYTYQFASQDLAVATVDDNGHVMRVTDGTAQITARINANLMKKTSRAISRATGASTDVFKNWVASSLGKNIYDTIAAAVLNKTASASTYNLYSATNDSAFEYTRNTANFLSAVDWTCIPVWNSFDPARYNGVVVADDCVLGAHHATIPSGRTMKFLTSDNQVITRTIIGSAQVSGVDLQALVLDSALPNTIHVCKVAPSNIFTARLPGYAWGAPVVRTNQFRELHLMATYSSGGSPGITAYPSTTAFQQWYRPYVNLDSGSGIFFVINGEPVMISVVGGATVWNNIAAINTAMTSAGSIRTVTQISLSGFTDFS